MLSGISDAACQSEIRGGMGMRKALLLGCLAQVVLLIVVLASGNQQVMLFGNGLLLMVAIKASVSSQASGGWEFIGTNEAEKKELYSLRQKVIFKWLSFMLPGVLTVLAYYLNYGELL